MYLTASGLYFNLKHSREVNSANSCPSLLNCAGAPHQNPIHHRRLAMPKIGTLGHS